MPRHSPESDLWLPDNGKLTVLKHLYSLIRMNYFVFGSVDTHGELDGSWLFDLILEPVRRKTGNASIKIGALVLLISLLRGQPLAYDKGYKKRNSELN
jgi:hypothetical protein